jgi:uncharacterized protein YgiM (DUF1202 family)
MLSFNRSGKTLSAVVLAGVLIFSLASCGGNDTPNTTKRTSTPTTTTTAPTTESTTVTTLFTVTGTLASNDEVVDWEVVDLPSATVKYVKVNEGFLKVRKGPGKDFEAVAALTKNMAVTVVGKTTTNWYKTDDGFYVSGDYLSNTKT